MNIQDYIKSGILEEYVAGLLSAEEMQAVEAYAAQEPLVLEEINKIEAALELYAFSQAQTPKNDVKSNILAQIEKETNTTETTPTTAKIVALPKPALRISYQMAAAAAACLVLSLGVNYNLYQKLNNANEKIANLRSENSKITQDYDILRTNNEAKSQQIATLADASTKRLVLKGTPNHSDAQLTIFWKADNQQVIASIDYLPKPPAGKQYQLWAIGKNGPVDAGMLNDSIKDFQAMKAIGDAAAFAITLENEGGSPTPTLEEMYAIGKF
jgi:anti-sigma-K factor RskA